MKKPLYFLIMLTFLLHLSPVYGVHVKHEKTSESEILVQPTIDLSDRKQVEQQLGRKLNFKERIALSLFKSNLKKNEKKAHKTGAAAEGSRTDGFAIAGFVLGVVSLFFAGILLGILAIVFSAVAMNRIDKSEGALNGKGFAIAGFILGIVGVVGAIIVLAGA